MPLLPFMVAMLSALNEWEEEQSSRILPILWNYSRLLLEFLIPLAGSPNVPMSSSRATPWRGSRRWRCTRMSPPAAAPKLWWWRSCFCQRLGLSGQMEGELVLCSFPSSSLRLLSSVYPCQLQVQGPRLDLLLAWHAVDLGSSLGLDAHLNARVFSASSNSFQCMCSTPCKLTSSTHSISWFRPLSRRGAFGNKTDPS